MSAAAVIQAPIECIKVAAFEELVDGLLPTGSRRALAGEHLSNPEHLFRRLYLHFIEWSSVVNLYIGGNKCVSDLRLW